MEYERSALEGMVNGFTIKLKPYIITSLLEEKNIKIKELLYKIRAILVNTATKLNFGAKSYRENELMKSRSNIEKFKKDFEWKPKVKLDEGLTKTIEWYRKRLGEKKGV